MTLVLEKSSKEKVWGKIKAIYCRYWVVMKVTRVFISMGGGRFIGKFYVKYLFIGNMYWEVGSTKVSWREFINILSNNDFFIISH
jgi:hypothetical protein